MMSCCNNVNIINSLKALQVIFIVHQYCQQDMQSPSKDPLSNNVFNYSVYHKLTTAMLFHVFVTALFMLWGLAVDMIGKELVASKFLHCVFPLLALHWWFLSHYPAYQLQHALAGRDRNAESFVSGVAWTNAKKRQEAMVFRNTVKIMLLFAVLFVVDFLYLLIKLAPIAGQCISHWNTGEKIPVECGGAIKYEDYTKNKEENHHNPNHLALYVLTLILVTIHIMSSLRTIYLVWSSRHYKLYSVFPAENQHI